MTDRVTCEIFLAINDDGGYVVHTDESEILNKLAENEGSYQAKLTVKVAPPQMTEATVDVSDEVGTTQDLETEAA